jgi:hypothetical protein
MRRGEMETLGGKIVLEQPAKLNVVVYYKNVLYVPNLPVDL